MKLNVLIYNGDGVCQLSFTYLTHFLKTFLNHAYDVQTIQLETLNNPSIDWHRSCALFVLPGGRDLKYLRDFGPIVIKRLKELVSTDDSLGGGRFLGVCAGAYFAAERVEFEVGRLDFEIFGERPLKLVDFSAKGPLNFGVQFNYTDDTRESDEFGIKIVEIKSKDDNLVPAYYHGGCYFDSKDCESSQNLDALATYTIDPSKIAVLGRKDSFVLSGVHFEHDPLFNLPPNLSLNPQQQEVLNGLRFGAESRRAFSSGLLEYLGLDVKCNPAGFDEPTVIYCYNYTFNSRVLSSLFDKRINLISTKLHNERIIPNSIFDPNSFYSLLNDPEHIPLLYTTRITSTQELLLKSPDLLDSLPNCSIVLADRQTGGYGRAKNYWISSPTSLQFTFVACLDQQSSFDPSKLPLIQHLTALSLAKTCNDPRIKIKWPNDIYYVPSPGCLSGATKIAGILVSSVNSSKFVIGVGFNLLDPSQVDAYTPSTIKNLNTLLDTRKWIKEAFLASFISTFRRLFEDFAIKNNPFPVESYYNYWIHSIGSKVSLQSTNESVIIEGIDQYGYLLAKDSQGNYNSLHPDGNSFDLTQNMIKVKCVF